MSDKMDFQSLSFGMRRIGWIRFWVQSILGVVVAAVLLFSNVVNNSEGQLGLAPGLSLTTISLILLLFSLWQGWLIVKTGRAIASNARPSRGQTGNLIKRGLIVDLFGILFGLIGYQALMGDVGELDNFLAKGANQAQAISESKLDEIKTKIGLILSKTNDLK